MSKETKREATKNLYWNDIGTCMVYVESAEWENGTLLSAKELEELFSDKLWLYENQPID